MLSDEFSHTISQVRTALTIVGWDEAAEALPKIEGLPSEQQTKALVQFTHALPAAAHMAWDPYLLARDAVTALAQGAARYQQYSGWSPSYAGCVGPSSLIAASRHLEDARHKAGEAALSFARHGHWRAP